MRRTVLAVALLLTAAPVAAAPYYRLSWEAIADSSTQPPCNVGSEGSWIIDLGTRATYHCESSTWVATAAASWNQLADIPAGFADGVDDTGTGGGLLLPSQSFIGYYGLRANIPAGWQECDGTNGTPDLRSQFVKGAAAGQEAGATGGSATHGHDYTDVVTHTHAVDVTDPGHQHVEQQASTTSGPLSGWARDTSTNNPVASGYSTDSATTGVTASTQAPAGSVATGTTAAASSEPQHVVTLFICKPV